MKILHIIYTEGVSGAEKYLKNLLPGLLQHNIVCELLIICPPVSVNNVKAFAAEINKAGVPSTILEVNNSTSYTTLKKVKNYLRSNKFYTVHSHLLRTDLIVSLIKQFYLKDLFIISTKHGYQEKTLINYNLKEPVIVKNFIYYVTKYTFQKINKNISISRFISELFISLKLTKEFFPVIYHGVNTTDNDLETAVDYKKFDTQLIIVGRLESYKGHVHAFKAFKIIASQIPEAKLLLLGEGSEKELLIEVASTLGLKDKIIFLGYKKNPYKYISQSDVILIPSVLEPFGLVFIEAMALKTPIVAFDVPAGNEILTHKKTGMLSPVFNENVLAENILFLLSNKIESNRIAENAFLSYQENFTTEIMIRNTANFYKSLSL